jgi:DNA-binding MarR family transcriptional regulator
MKKQSIAELALEFGRAMREMRSSFRQNVQVKIKESDINISFELLEIIALLWSKDGINQQELAEIAIKDKSSMTYLVDNLVRRNLVTRVEDGRDRRNKLVFLTEEGKALEKKLHPLLNEMYDKAADNVNAADMEKAILVVRNMNENLKNKN